MNTAFAHSLQTTEPQGWGFVMVAMLIEARGARRREEP